MITGSSTDAALSHPVGLAMGVAGGILHRVAIATLCVVALITIGLISFGSSFEGTDWTVLVSVISVLPFSLAALAAIAAIGREPRWMGPAGLVWAGVGLAIWELSIWFGSGSDFAERAAFLAALLAISVTHANLLLAEPGRDDPAIGLLAATIVVNAVLTALSALLIAFDSFPANDVFWKMYCVLAVLLGLGTLLVPIVRRIGPVRAGPVDAGKGLFTPAEGAGWLELNYRGQTILLEMESAEGESAGPLIRAWSLGEKRERQFPLDNDEATADAHAAMGRAVQQITRAIDAGQI